MNRDELRQYFNYKGLTYEDVRLRNLGFLEAMCDREFSTQRLKLMKENKAVYWHSTNPIKKYCRRADGMYAYLTARGGYFTEREVVSFYLGGNISFCAEASDNNLVPVANAFINWCDFLAAEKAQGR